MEFTPFQKKLLKALSSLEKGNVDEVCRRFSFPENDVRRDSVFLHSMGVLDLEEIERYHVKLTDNGEEFSNSGLPERIILDKLDAGYIFVGEFQDLDPQHVSLGINELRRKRAIEVQRESDDTMILPSETIEQARKNISALENYLRALKENPVVYGTPEQLKELKRRKLVKVKAKPDYVLSLSESGKNELENMTDSEEVGDLTPEMIRTGKWKGVRFKEYDVSLHSQVVHGGKQNPLTELIDKVRRVFISMGFKEMKGPLVEASFYNFDTLFMPQDHPAREMQDTFFVRNPRHASIPSSVAEKVRKAHRDAYEYKWDEETSRQNILRTHTTATSSRYMLKDPEIPAKYFSVARVFRNETPDAFHLPEFHQIEGFVTDEGLSIRDLMGNIQKFYDMLGIKKLRYKPTYNPYTEPSMEIFAYFPEYSRYIEIGNSGLFRPEVLETHGIEYPTIAWGLALERLAALVYNKESISDMLGCHVDVNWIRGEKRLWLQ
jgi:phenylalanyl-tRNA synthetase alpha chain